jgi:hypothetical protein
MRTRYHFNGEFLPPSKIAKILKISIGKLESYINRIPESITDNDEFERRLKKIVEDKKEKKRKISSPRKYTDWSDYSKEELDNQIWKRLEMYERMDLSKGLTFDLDVKWFKENILGKACIYCGDTKNLGCDRINNNIGHVKDNCVPCCYLCNITRKEDYTFEEMKILGRAIREIKEHRQSVDKKT